MQENDEIHLPALAPAQAVDPIRLKLRRGLWVARAYYFFFFAALGTIAPLLNVYLDGLGFSGREIGLIAAVAPLVALAAGPFWSAAADQWHAHQRVLALLAGVAGAASLLLLWFHTFGAVLLIMIVLNFFRAPISAILDGTVMGLVSRYGDQYDIQYGRQRAFGSLGWIVASFSAGFIAALVSIEAIFWIHWFALGLMCMLLSFKLPVEGHTERVNYFAGIRELIRLPGYRGILVFLTAFGVGVASNANFLGLHILALGGTTVMIGIANAANAIPEIPVMSMGDRWMRRWGSRRLILIGGVGFTITWLLMGSATQAWHFPLITPLIGLFYGLSWVPIVAFANNSAPPGMRASAQGIANAAMGGLGVAVGAFMAGILWDRYGGEVVFLAAAGVMLLGTAYFWWSTRTKVIPASNPQA